jgi:hypothetical protein
MQKPTEAVEMVKVAVIRRQAGRNGEDSVAFVPGRG